MQANAQLPVCNDLVPKSHAVGGSGPHQGSMTSMPDVISLR